MLNRNELAIVITTASEAFVRDLGDRFKDHVSNTFIVAFLVDRFEDLYRANMKQCAKNIAYATADHLFEYLLECKCGASCNGHHVAQQYCDYFREGEINMSSFNAEYNIHYSGK